MEPLYLCILNFKSSADLYERRRARDRGNAGPQQSKRSARLPERQRGGPAHGSGSCSERATFYVTGTEHSVTSATASAWEPTPWRAVQHAAWKALGQRQ